MADTDIITSTQVGALVKAKANERGGPTAAGKYWGVSTQMVHLVIQNQRRPAEAMLADLGLEAVVSKTVSYRKAGGG